MVKVDKIEYNSLLDKCRNLAIVLFVGVIILCIGYRLNAIPGLSIAIYLVLSMGGIEIYFQRGFKELKMKSPSAQKAL